MIVLIQLYILIGTLFLAGKDASSYRMKDKSGSNELVMLKRIKRWHRDGVALNILLVLPFVYYTENYWIILYALLIRLSAFDPSFNHWGGLPKKYLGSTALFDKMFILVFGKHGAIKKSLAFAVTLVAANLVIHFNLAKHVYDLFSV